MHLTISRPRPRPRPRPQVFSLIAIRSRHHLRGRRPIPAQPPRRLGEIHAHLADLIATPAIRAAHDAHGSREIVEPRFPRGRVQAAEDIHQVDPAQQIALAGVADAEVDVRELAEALGGVEGREALRGVRVPRVRWVVALDPELVPERAGAELEHVQVGRVGDVVFERELAVRDGEDDGAGV